MASLASDAAAFRHFTRTYTRLIGTLDEGLLHTEYSLAEGRVIYELATRAEPRAKEIAQELGMDPGYLSRILGKFKRAGLLKRKVSARDGRVADLALTRQGRKAFETLNALAEKQARGILRNLPPADRARLIRSMSAIEEVLAGDSAQHPPFILRPHRPGDMGWVVHREGALYAEEYGFDQTFEALVARIVADFITNFDAARERCWIAEMDGEAVGHVFLVKHPEEPDTAKLRLLLVESSARGKGLGHALVNECVRFARAASYRRITLWTQSILVEAHRIYQKAGFRLVKEEPHHSFGVDLVGQTWELDLRPAAKG
ncbi:MAG TPA: helix-turn-helix domain-containing GNAT family N-acetyltransferase [Bryobacteraceae bacterium]|nr:helix-turn-helix domain-containing GNAT family N-acetyltransferase [Bryobacteraceae bacterium]